MEHRAVIESLDGRVLFAAHPVATIGAATVMPQATTPSIKSITQPASLTNARRDLTIVAALNLPNGAINFSKLFRDEFRIYEVDANGNKGARVPTGNLQTSGGGDTLSITPTDPLKAYTTYSVEINQTYDTNSNNYKIRDVANYRVDPYKFSFKTGADIAIADPSINFNQQQATTTAEAAPYTAVTTGPDGKLYAATLNGYIYRWAIGSDGTLSNRQTITTVLDNNTDPSTNPDGNRIITGITFDPNAPAGTLKLWVSHGQYKLGTTPTTGNGVQYQADNFTGKISVLSGSNLQSYNDVIVGIPRSVKDHMNNQIAFDTAKNNMFFVIPAMNAMGKADTTWGNRDENLLSAAMIKVNLAKLDTELTNTGGPIDLTNATYDATNPSNALNIYATGVRNAYDMVFASNGKLYAGVNGSSAGGNTPAGGGAPGLTNVPQTEEDMLLSVEPGKYYGHPNPSRGQYVLDGGNPTADEDPYEFAATSTSAANALYPVGVQPDSNYALPAYDLGKNVSPNGMLEYHSVSSKTAALDGSLLICRYNSGQDILSVKPNSDGTVSKSNVQARITGLTGLTNPLDITEDAGTGNLYVAQLDEAGMTGSIALMKPIDANPVATPQTQNSVPYRTVHYVAPGNRKGQNKTITVINSGTTTLEIDSSATKFTGPAKKNFVLLNLTTDDIRILPGESFTFNARGVLARGQTKVSGNLLIKVNQPGLPYLQFQLRAVSIFGDGNTPASLAANVPASTGVHSATLAADSVFGQTAVADPLKDLLA